MAGQRLLVFGGSGMLGRDVVREARARGAAALGLSRGQADVTDEAQVRYWAESFRPDVVVNCAAYTKVDECESERDRALAINGHAVGHVAAAAQGVGAALIHVSTDYVFPGDAERPYREDDETGPRSVYGESKLEGERRALQMDRALVLRTSWLFGPGGPNFVRTISRLIGEVSRGERQGPLKVVDDQTGCPTYTPFLARAILDLAPRVASGDVRGVLHYGNRDAVTWYDFAREIGRSLDRNVEILPVTTEEFPRPAPRPAYSVLDVGRFEDVTGRTVEPWGWGLLDYLASIRMRRASA